MHTYIHWSVAISWLRVLILLAGTQGKHHVVRGTGGKSRTEVVVEAGVAACLAKTAEVDGHVVSVAAPTHSGNGADIG